MASVIVAAPAIWAETAPLLEVARHLVDRGHRVTVITGSRFGDAARGTGAAFAPLHGAADFDATALFQEFPDRALHEPGPDLLDFDMTNAFVNALPVQRRVLQDVLGEHPGSVLVCNALFLGSWPEAFGAPGRTVRRHIAVACTPVTLGTPQATVLGPVPAADGSPDPAATEAANADLRSAMADSHRRLAELVRAYGGDTDRVPASILDGFVTVPDRYVALCVRELDFGRTDLPGKVTFAGPIATGSGVGPDDEVQAALHADRPVVLVTQGTTANEDLDDVVQPALDGLAGDDVTVIAATGKSPVGLRLPGNALAREWVPFDAVMPSVVAFVTNGGWGGTQAAVAAGVPVVVAGATEDKALVAARVRVAGVGVDLGTVTPSPTAIRDAVRSVMASAAIRANVASIVPAYEGNDPLSAISALIP